MQYRTIALHDSNQTPAVAWSLEHGNTVRVLWSEVARLLGKPYVLGEATDEDDNRIRQALRASNAPAWVSWAFGGVDEKCWYLVKP